jgi:hypothetical protein
MAFNRDRDSRDDWRDRRDKREAEQRKRDEFDASFGRGPLVGRTGNPFVDDPFFNPWAPGGSFDRSSSTARSKSGASSPASPPAPSADDLEEEVRDEQAVEPEAPRETPENLATNLNELAESLANEPDPEKQAKLYTEMSGKLKELETVCNTLVPEPAPAPPPEPVRVKPPASTYSPGYGTRGYDPYDGFEQIQPKLPDGGARPLSLGERATVELEVRLREIEKLDASSFKRAGLSMGFMISDKSLKAILDHAVVIPLAEARKISETDHLCAVVLSVDSIRHETWHHQPGRGEPSECTGSGYSEGHSYLFERKLLCCVVPGSMKRELTEAVDGIRAAGAQAAGLSANADNKDERWQIRSSGGDPYPRGGDRSKEYRLRESVDISAVMDLADLQSRVAGLSLGSPLSVNHSELTIDRYSYRSRYDDSPRGIDPSLISRIKNAPEVTMKCSFTDREMFDRSPDYRIDTYQVDEVINVLRAHKWEQQLFDWGARFTP